jgi:hypothetical protein
MLQAMQSDYVRTARAKGLFERVVIWKHAMRNALTPVITLGALEFGTLLSGAVLTEQIFSIPGFGKLIVDAVFNRDYAVVQGVVLVTATTYILLNLLADVAYILAAMSGRQSSFFFLGGLARSRLSAKASTWGVSLAKPRRYETSRLAYLSWASLTSVRLPKRASASSKNSTTSRPSARASTAASAFSVSPMYFVTSCPISTRSRSLPISRAIVFASWLRALASRPTITVTSLRARDGGFFAAGFFATFFATFFFAAIEHSLAGPSGSTRGEGRQATP